METMTQNIDLNNLDKSTWETFKFEDMAQKISKTVKPDEAEVDIYIGLEHVDANDIHIRRKGVPADVKGGKLRCYPGDVIFGKRRAYQRKAAIVDFDGICSAHAFVFRANEDIIDSKLFPFFLHSDQFMHRMVDISVGGLSPTINWGDLKQQEFLLPSKDQQAKLAELLWAMDEVIEKENEVLEKQYVIKEVLRRDYFVIKNNSKTVKIGKVAELTAGGTPSTAKLEYWENGIIPWLSSGEVNKKRVFQTDKLISEIGLKESSAKLMPIHTCLIALAGQGKTKGTVAISEIELSTNQSVAAIIANREMIEPYYLYHNMDSRYLDFRHITGKHNSRTGLNLKILKDFEIVYHNKNERESITRKFNSLDKNIELIESKISSSKALQKSLINQVF